MNRQKIFVEMMAALIGKPISLEEKIGQSKAELETSCKKLSDEIGTPFEVDMKGNEPCPFYCSSIDKPIDFVFVGINPGKVLEYWPTDFSWQSTTWQELVDFCVPTTDIRLHEKNGYQFLKENNVENPYYKFFLRLHLALTTDKIYTWDELKNKHADVKSFFIEHIATHSILNADLVPYKYKENSGFNVTKLLNDANYAEYFRQLIRFIETETSPDAWIIFYGRHNEVKRLLNKFAPDWKAPADNLYLKVEGKEKGNLFHLFNRGRQKILLSPFLTGRVTSPIVSHLHLLIDELKNFERTLTVS